MNFWQRLALAWALLRGADVVEHLTPADRIMGNVALTDTFARDPIKPKWWSVLPMFTVFVPVIVNEDTGRTATVALLPVAVTGTGKRLTVIRW